MVNLNEELGYFTEREMAAFIGCKLQSLRNQRSRGQGPPFTKIGRAVKYPKGKALEYFAAKTVTPGEIAPTLIDGDHSRRGSRAVAA